MITTSPSPAWRRGTRKREERPERIDVKDDVLIRNDIMADQKGGSERALNRLDALGAPFVHVFGCKYRPLRGFEEFLASQIQRRGRQPKRRGGKR